MYAPLLIGRKYTNKYDCNTRHSRVIYSPDYTQFDRFFYHHKCRIILRSLESKVNVSSYHLVHAHYLFSAGGVAWKLKQTWGIPFVAAVRSTDDYLFRWAIHLRQFGCGILNAASRIVFLSPAIRDKILHNYVPSALRACIAAKSEVVPNGVNDFWHENKFVRPEPLRRKIRLLFVGEFTRRKNIEMCVAVTRLLRERGRDATLKIIGGGATEARVRKLARKHADSVEVQPWLESKTDLMTAYRQADIFLMPSFHETFGLVYVEAMSQGLPVIYSRGQGIDGYFTDGTVGFRCDPASAPDIGARVEAIVQNYPRFSQRCVASLSRFSWKTIAPAYEEMYRAALINRPT